MLAVREVDLPAGSLAPGTVLMGKWRIVGVLAKGGMSTVYEAVHRNGRRVAVKVLHPALAADRRARARFLRESSLANRVNHHAIVAVIDEDMTPDGTVFLVMELLAGESLDQRWERHSKCLPLPEVLSIAAEILDPLAAVHDVGIIHRDLKPSNVFLSSTGVKILDFGIAGLRELNPDEPAITRSGTMLGTPPFMAPEQARGHLDDVDARTDIWAVGAILFSLLTGRFVHEGRTPNELLIAAATQQPVSLARMVPALPINVTLLVDRALSFHKKDRWPDAATMLREVQAIRAALREPADAVCEARSNPTLTSVGQETAPEERSPMKPVPTTLGRRNAVWLALGVIGLVLLAGGIGLRSSLGATDPSSPPRAEPGFAQSLVPPERPDDARESRSELSTPEDAVGSAQAAPAKVPAPLDSAGHPGAPHVRSPRQGGFSQRKALTTTTASRDIPSETDSTPLDVQPNGATFSGIVVDDDALDQRK